MVNYDLIIDPQTNKKYKLVSKNGKNVLKQYIKTYQSGGKKKSVPSYLLERQHECRFATHCNKWGLLGKNAVCDYNKCKIPENKKKLLVTNLQIRNQDLIDGTPTPDRMAFLFDRLKMLTDLKNSHLISANSEIDSVSKNINAIYKSIAELLEIFTDEKNEKMLDKIMKEFLSNNYGDLVLDITIDEGDVDNLDINDKINNREDTSTISSNNALKSSSLAKDSNVSKDNSNNLLDTSDIMTPPPIIPPAKSDSPPPIIPPAKSDSPLEIDNSYLVKYLRKKINADKLPSNEKFNTAEEVEDYIDEEWEKIIGMEDIKDSLLTAGKTILVEKLLEEEQDKEEEEEFKKKYPDETYVKKEKKDRPSYHILLAGPPGTGKTFIAKIIAKVYHKLGVCKSSNVLTAQTADLTGRYVGASTAKTRDLIHKAWGGVLFIDEAYQLAESSFGKQAFATIMSFMDKPPSAPKGMQIEDAPIFIFAGYENEMLGYCEEEEDDGGCKRERSRYQKEGPVTQDNPEAFIRLNAGMDRRIRDKFRFIFKPYSPEVIYDIYMKKLEMAKFKIDYSTSNEEEETQVKQMIKELIVKQLSTPDCRGYTKDKNGGFAEAMYHKTREYHLAKNVSKKGKLLVIKGQDLIDSLIPEDGSGGILQCISS